MALATVYFQEFNGEAGVEVPTSKQASPLQFTAIDSPDVEEVETAAHALVSPNAGVFRSYEKWLRVCVESLGDSTSISNLEVFVNGDTPNDGISVWVKTAEVYATPKVGGYASAGAMTAPKTNLFATSSDDPISLGAGPFEAAEDVGLYLVVQMEVLPSAGIGLTSSYSLVLRYDEE